MPGSEPSLATQMSLVRRLLEERFSGSDALRTQAESSKVRIVGPHHSPTLVFEVDGGAPRAFVTHRIAVEGEAVDEDGMKIHVLLHVVKGMLNELEVFREDGQRILRYPSASSLAVWSSQARS